MWPSTRSNVKGIYWLFNRDLGLDIDVGRLGLLASHQQVKVARTVQQRTKTKHLALVNIEADNIASIRIAVGAHILVARHVGASIGLLRNRIRLGRGMRAGQVDDIKAHFQCRAQSRNLEMVRIFSKCFNLFVTKVLHRWGIFTSCRSKERRVVVGVKLIVLVAGKMFQRTLRNALVSSLKYTTILLLFSGSLKTSNSFFSSSCGVAGSVECIIAISSWNGS